MIGNHIKQTKLKGRRVGQGCAIQWNLRIKDTLGPEQCLLHTYIYTCISINGGSTVYWLIYTTEDCFKSVWVVVVLDRE